MEYADFPNIIEDIIEFQVEDSQAVQGEVLFVGNHIGELRAVTH